MPLPLIKLIQTGHAKVLVAKVPIRTTMNSALPGCVCKRQCCLAPDSLSWVSRRISIYQQRKR
jgi:hypothetical protein